MIEIRPAHNERVPLGMNEDLSDRILDMALAMAEESGWGALRLYAVAERAGISLARLQSHYRDKDAIANAWFAQALEAMLAPPPDGFAGLPAEKRLFIALMRWFDALAPHREVTGEMLSEKLHLPHAHHWVPMIFDLSRTIHWLCDAALLDAGGRRRQLEEVGLTVLFLATLAIWRRDESPGQERTRAFLRRRLGRADRAMVRLWGAAPPPAERAENPG